MKLETLHRPKYIRDIVQYLTFLQILAILQMLRFYYLFSLYTGLFSLFYINPALMCH